MVNEWTFNLRDNYKSIYLLDLNEIFYTGSKEIFSDRGGILLVVDFLKGLNMIWRFITGDK